MAALEALGVLRRRAPRGGDVLQRFPGASGREPARRQLWTPSVGYRPRRDDPHRRPVLSLREGVDARLRRGHPWVFPRDVRNAEELSSHSPCLVNVEASDGDVLGVALYNRHGTISARMLAREAFVQVDAPFFAERLRGCLSYRERLFAEPFYRLVHGEADGLPGLVIDRFDDHICVQPSAAALDALLWPIMDAVEEVLQSRVVVIRQDAIGRRRERAPIKREVLKGPYRGPTEIREGGVTFSVDLLNGQKTGWFYNHRDHRSQMAALAPMLPRVLDLYSYVGGFGLTMAQYGSEEVVCVDSSEAAVELCTRAAALNAIGGRVRAVRSDAIEFLERPDAGEYDLVLVDPPNLGSDKSAVPKAIRLYERLLCSAAKVCAPGGMLFVACCTYHIGERELLGAANSALRWAGRSARLVSTGGQAADHPGHLALPELRYLRSALLQLD